MSTISFPDWINSLSPQSTDGKDIYQQDGSTPSRGDLDDKASLSGEETLENKTIQNSSLENSSLENTPIGQNSTALLASKNSEVYEDDEKIIQNEVFNNITGWSSGATVELFRVRVGTVAQGRGSGASILLSLNVSARNSDNQVTSANLTVSINITAFRRFFGSGPSSSSSASVTVLSSERYTGGASLFSVGDATPTVSTSNIDNETMDVIVRVAIPTSDSITSENSLGYVATNLSSVTRTPSTSFKFIKP